MTEIMQKNLEKIKKSFWGFFIQRRPIAWLITIAIVLLGTFSLITMPREIQPEVNIPFIAVTTALPGANPADTETLISKPLENEIANVSDIQTLSSQSGFGFSFIFIEFDVKTDIDTAVQNIKDAIDRAKVDLPEDATEPRVIKAEANAFSIISFSITGDRPLHELTIVAEDIQIELEKISGISSVEIIGDQQKYIEVALDQQKMEGYNLDIQTITNLIKFSNNNLPIGIISSDQLNYSVRIDNRYQSLEDLRNLPLFTTPDQTPILLSDIATVEETFPPQNVFSKLSINGEKAFPTVSLQLYKKDKTNILKIADTAREKVEELKTQGSVPKDVEVAVSNDNSEFIREELGNLTRTGVQTALVITFILFLALGLRQGIIAGLSIPVIFLIAFIIMDSQGISLNTLSLFSLVIALGLIVDTTIVIMEGIHENLRKGATPKEAALLSVQTYKWPLIAGTATTIFAFFPMLLVGGLMGEFLKTMPITISAALFGSIFVALTIAPSITAKFVKARKEGKRSSILEPVFDKIGAKFHNIIRYLIQRRTARFLIILTAITAFAASMSLPVTGILKTEMFTLTDQNYFVMNIETEKGILVEETKKIVEEVEGQLYDIPEVENFLTNIGTSQAIALTEESVFFGGGSDESHLATITVNLLPKEGRERKSYEIAREINDEFKNFPNAKVQIEQLKEGPPGDAAITARITGEDLEVLKGITDEVQIIMENIPGTTNVQQSLKPGLNEFKFTLDKDKLAFHGLSSIQTSVFIRNIIQGINAATITIEGDEKNIIVRYALPEKNDKTNISIHDIENFEIPTPKGYSVTLAQLGDYEFDQSLASIDREGQKRIIKVTSDVEKDVNVVETNEKIAEKTAKLELPQGYNIRFGGDMEQIIESLNDLFKSMIVAIILIAFTLVLMFNSFKQPLIILITLPLALIGVFPGLLAIGLNLSFPAFLGVVALAGIVVNDAIVLIDRINKNRKNKIPFAEAIAEATNARLQPIFMTSITTIVGILPLALINELWRGLGFTLIFGLIASTALMLIVVPTLYYVLEGRKAKKLEQVS